MRYSSNFPQPSVAERALIKRTAKALIKKYGNCNRAAKRIGVNSKYLYAIVRGDKCNPGNTICRKLGLRRVCYIEER